MKIFVISGFLLLLTASCGVSKKVETPPTGMQDLTVVQGDKRIIIAALDTTISIAREAFTLEFICQKYDGDNDLFHATRIAATQDPEAVNTIMYGPIPSDQPFFGEATGMSAGSAE